MSTVTRATLLFEADLDIAPFMHDNTTIRRLHIVASATDEPGFWWAEGVGTDADGEQAHVYALTPADLPTHLLGLVEQAYCEARDHIPERIIG